MHECMQVGTRLEPNALTRLELDPTEEQKEEEWETGRGWPKFVY